MHLLKRKCVGVGGRGNVWVWGERKCKAGCLWIKTSPGFILYLFAFIDVILYAKGVPIESLTARLKDTLQSSDMVVQKFRLKTTNNTSEATNLIPTENC